MSFNWQLRVYWEDTDAGGIVFYANYLKYFERARTEWLRHLGLEQHILRQQTGGMFVVSDAQISYKQPAVLDDVLRVSAHLTQSGRASLLIEQQAHRVNPEGGPDVLLCQGQIRIGWVDTNTLKPARIPTQIIERLT